LPAGGSAQYQLSVEAIDPTWSVDVGPYAPYQVAPSGSLTPIVITVAAGQQVEQDILMSPCAQPVPPWFSTDTWTAPAAVAAAGDWVGSMGDYGDSGYFALPLQANRTLSVSVTALDETGNASESKVQPVIGMWLASDPEGTSPPAMTPSPFNSLTFGMTQLNAQVATSGNFLIGISDLRGDGRPDYHYHANVLYADSVTPTRVGVGGGPVTVLGTGFGAGLAAAVGMQSASPLAIDAGQMIVSLPPQADGPQSITISSPATGGSSTMTNAVIYGAAASDSLILLEGKNPPTPVGTQATNPVRVLVLASDGVTPVSGATIAWTAPTSVQLSACGGGFSCSVATDQSGTAETWLTPTSPVVDGITARLAPASYYPAQSVSATLDATDPSSAIGVLTPFLWIAQGASLSTTLTARVLSNGAPQANTGVSFTIVSGLGTLSAASAQTNSTGYATVTLSVSQISALVQVSACVAQAGTPCQTIYANAVPGAQLQLQQVAGAGQIVPSGQPFQPVIVRVTDSSSPPNAVLGAVVTFQTAVLRPVQATSASGNPVTPTILSVSQSGAVSDSNGLAGITPSSGGFSGPLQVDVAIAAGNVVLNDGLEVLPAPGGVGSSGGDSAASRAAARTLPP
jgi:hypothetical protein